MKLPITINEHSGEPLYIQIESQLRTLILSGVIVSGTMLPSIRELASQMKCSVITIKRVYSDLEAEGIIRTKQGTGTYVLELQQGSFEKQKEEALQEALDQFLVTAKQLNADKNLIKTMFDEAISSLE